MEFVVSESYRKKKDISDSRLEIIQQTRHDQANSILERLSPFDHSSEKQYQEIIDSSKKHLQSIYKNVGINLDEGLFSNIYIFNEEDRQSVSDVVGFSVDGSEGEVITGLGSAIVFVRDETRQILPSIVHHEYEHLIGRSFDILNSIGVGQVVGYTTSMNSGEIRGEALEEALVVNNSVIFQETFDNENLSLVDKILVKNIPDKYNEVVSAYEPEMSMLFTLVEGVKALAGSEVCTEFIKDLVAGRIDSNRRFRMQKKLILFTEAGLRESYLDFSLETIKISMILLNIWKQ